MTPACCSVSTFDASPAGNKTMKKIWQLCGLLGLLAAISVLNPARAAGLCSFSPIALTIPGISTVSGAAYTATANTTITCTGLPVGEVRVCLQIGTGSAMDPASLTTRYMTNGSYGLQYNVFTDAGYSTIWGTYSTQTAGYTDVVLTQPNVAVLLFNGTGTLPLYFKIPASQTTLPVGTYNASLTASTNATYVQWLLNISHACNTTIEASLGTVPITITGSVVADCRINTTNIGFGNNGLLNTVLSANGSISVQCTNGSPYTIALDKGSTPTGTLTDRQMKSGSNVVHYQLYKEAAFANVWGDSTSGTALVSGTGTGNSQTWTVYAKVPIQTTPAVGTYTDTITATVSF